jgi:tryptophanyl-tRNA synthetase
MARDIAQRFNHLYGKGADFFVLPEAQIDESVATLPGLDGRKMSKSYNNTIPLFEGGAKALRAAVMRIVTDSRLPGEPKDAEASHVYTLYHAFATPEQSSVFRQQLEEGLGWGDAKKHLCDRIEQDLAPMRERYAQLMAAPRRIEEILQAGATKARAFSSVFMAQLRDAVGIRQIGTGRGAAKHSTIDLKGAAGKQARFVSFRDDHGQFRFRLLDSEGRELLLSEPFSDPKASGLAIQRLKSSPLDGLSVEREGVAILKIGDTVISRFESAKLVSVQAALAGFDQN